MMSRRKQAAERARGSPEEGRLRRPRAARLNRTALSAGEPPPGAAEEISSNKTPKRLSRSNQWASTFSSPNNEELQQEIFWDPQSPTPYKSENEKRKRAGKCGVEISDIVNRIAPRDEKPTSSEVALLGMWIGENAIPCTPGVGTVRTRTKICGTKHKIKNTEEELMKLAKQFDKNLVDAIQEQDVQTEIIAYEESLNNRRVNGEQNAACLLQKELPEGELVLSMQKIKESTRTSAAEQCESSSQKSLDQEAEAAFNALFDSSTQKCSGRLSQGLSDVSQKSSSGSETKEINLQTTKAIQYGENISNLKQPSVTLFSVEDQMHTPERKNTSLPKQVSTNRDDFDDDWGTDLLEDDSFIMQITQNPELIKTPKHSLTLSKLSTNSPVSSEDAKRIGPNGHSMTLSSKVNHFKFQPSKSCKDANAPSKSVQSSHYSKVDCSVQDTESFTANRVRSCETSTQNKALKMTSQILMKPKVIHSEESLQLKDVTIGNVTQTGLCSNLKRCRKPNSLQTGNYNQNTDTLVCFSLSGSPSQNKSNNLGETVIQANSSNPDPAAMQSKESNTLDEWNDPKFSEEMLDLFCESDSLFEANEEEDNLLYQVCDDIEKQTQNEDIQVVNDKYQVVQRGNGVCKTDAKSIQFCPQLMQNNLANRNTFSLATNSSSVNQVASQGPIGSASLETATSKLPTVCKPMIFQSCKPAISGNKTDDVQGKFNRSNSTPSEAFRSFSRDQSQNTVKPLSSSSIIKAPVVLPPVKFTFTNIKTSQLSTVHNNRSETIFHTEIRRQNCEHKTHTDMSLPGNIPINQRPALKRQLSESFLQSTKVLSAEERSQKCSQEEIERKKREARERLKKRTQSLQKDR